MTGVPAGIARSVEAAATLPLRRLRGARSLISTGLVRTGRLIGSPGSLDPRARQLALDSLEGELDDLIDDVAARGVSERQAEDLSLTSAIVRWLGEGGDLPAKGSIELMEIHAAIFNGARHEEELELQWAFAQVLVALVEAHAEAIASGRWRERRVDDEYAERRDRRRFGAHLNELRRSRASRSASWQRGPNWTY